MPTKLSDYENRVYLAIWRKAGRSAAEFTIKMASDAEAHALRMGLYRAIRPYRNESKVDPELKAASDKWVVVVKKGTNEVLLAPRKGDKIAERLMTELGISEADLLTPEEIEAREVVERIKKNLESPAGDAGVENKFYSREEE